MVNDPESADLPPELQQAIQRFRDWAEQRVQAEEKQNQNSITEPLYHYTTACGLKGILESGQIWFTDYRHLNDPSELVHGINMAHSAAQTIMDDLSQNEGNELPVSFLKLFVDMFQHSNFKSKLEFYIASFSRARNDLGQWRAYADNGRGFAIGFAPIMFETKNHTTDCRLPEFLGPVIYLEDKVLDRQHAVLETAAAIYCETLNAHRELLRNKDIGILFMQVFAREMIAQPLIWNCLTSKHQAYEHEQEVRLVILGKPAKLWPHVTTRCRGAEVVPYIKHPMPVRANIAEIVIGPAAPTDTARTLRVMVNSLGIDPTSMNIDLSRIPYRAL
jgi:hypothetical protein